MNDHIEEREPISMVAEQGMVAILNKSEIDQQIATAHRFPRSIKRFVDESMQMVTLNESVAQECIYALPRDGKTIEGPSARFAEIIASAWGNSRSGARVISDQGEFVTAQGVFHDLERNVAITYEVQRRITGKGAKRYSLDMIGVTANAACSIALRNAILKGVPKAFWASMYEAARKVIMGDIKTLANRRAAAVSEFQRYGIAPEQICAKLEVAGAEDISLEHLVVLRGLLTAIKEGDTTPEEAFSATHPGKPVQMPRRKPKDAQASVPKAPLSPDDGTRPAVPASAAASGVAPAEEAPRALSDTQQRLLGERMRRARVTEANIREQYGDVTTANLNTVLADLRGMAEAEAQAAQQ